MTSALHKYRDREDGFTLIELLIVVLIIGILAAVAIPVYLGIQSTARHSSVQADVNITVKRVQVSLTEGGTLGAAATSFTDSSVRSDKNTVTTTNLTSGNAPRFTVQGVSSVDGYTYTYDSGAGTYTESTTALGGGSTATAAPVFTPTYSSVYIVANNSYPYGDKTVTYGKTVDGSDGSCPAYAFTTGSGRFVRYAATGGGITYTVTKFENGGGQPTPISVDSNGYLNGNVALQSEFGVTIKATNSYGSATISQWIINDAC